VIQLTVTNTNGSVARSLLTLKYLDDGGDYIVFSGEEGDYISGGQTQILTSNDGNINVSRGEEALNYIGVIFDGSDFWSLDFASAEGEALAVGQYTGATRYPFQSPTGPGFDIGGAGRGCNRSYGEFEILELNYDSSGEVETFAANFTQRCTSETNPELKGAVRINSSMPYNDF